MGNRRDIATHQFKKEDPIFFDANIWIYILGPQGAPNDARTRTYSAAFNRLIKAECKLYIDVLVLSEFANRYARLEYATRDANGQYVDYKAFRNSQDFAEVAQAIADSMRRILEHSIPIESGFSDLNHSAFASQLENGSCDFNDMVITALCVSNSFFLVTHDSDFEDEDVSILTANGKLLQPSGN